MKAPPHRGSFSISGRDLFLAVIVVVTVVLLPLGSSELRESALVLPGAFVATIAFDVVSLVLVWQQFQRTGNRRYLVIAVAFVYAVVDQTFWLLSVPGLVSTSDTGVFGVPGGPVYVGTWWSIFSLIVAIGIARWPSRWESAVPIRRRLETARWILLVALVVSLLWMAVALYVVPQILTADSFADLVLRAQAIAVPLAVASVLVAVTGRHEELLLRWALVVPITSVCIELLYLAGVERFTVGWYAAKALTVIDSGILAVVLLADHSAAYRRAEDRVTQSELLLGRTLAAAGSPVAIFRRDAKGEWSADFAGESARERLGVHRLVSPESPYPAPPGMRRLLEDAAWQGRAESTDRAEDAPLVRCSAVAVGVGQVVVTWQGESAAERAEQVQEVVRSTDEVTGLPNRDSLLALIGEKLGSGTPLLLAYLDLDGFAVMNDRYGYSLGDKLLGEIGRRFVSAVGSEGAVSRLGSDDFAVAFFGECGVPDAEAALRGALAEPFEVAGDRVLVSATHGYVLSSDGAEPGQLTAQARNAMLNAREQGRGSSAVHDPLMPTLFNPTETTREEFATALEMHEFALQYQPILWQRSRRLWGYEALVTWDHPRLGPLPPGAYLPDAERWGLTSALGQWVTRTACAASAETGRLITINLGAADLSRPGLCWAVMSEAERAGCDPGRLVIELTESALLHAGSAAVTNVIELHEQGIRVALDDFGTGFAALGYLAWLPVDVIKVDRQVIDPRVAEPPPGLLRSVVDLAHSVGALALAEGIENEETARRVKLAGFDLVQGFFYGRPAPWEQIRSAAPGFVADGTGESAAPGPEGTSQRSHTAGADI